MDWAQPPRMLGIVGAGVMGRGIAQVAAEAGFEVLIGDIRAEAGAEAKAFCAGLIGRKASKGQIDAASAERAVARITPVDLKATGFAAFAPCDLVIEAVAERLDVKSDVLASLEAAIDATCIIATNTSSLSVTALAALARRPERIAGMHFFNPVPLMKLVEVIGGLRTDPAVLDRLTALVGELGHRAVRVADTPGFLVNHASRGFGLEALRIVQENVCGFADVDRILVEAAGFRMGPFEVYDLVGLDVSRAVMESIYRQYFEEPRYRPSFAAEQRVTAGLLGRKTGRGFYSYRDSTIERPLEAATPDVDPTRMSYWVSRREPDAGAALQAVLHATGLRVETGDAPSDEAVILVTPFGADCTAAALAEHLDPQRTVAVDCLFDLAGRRTLMSNPATRAEVRDAAHAALSLGGHKVTRIADSGGFVAQRIVASIINTGCEIAQQGISTPADIDAAVRLGLGYPRGPLDFGTVLGPRRVLQILDTLATTSHDPTYRASPWLRRRAALDLPLQSV